MVLTYLAIPVAHKRLLKLLRVKSGAGAPAANIRHLKQLNVEVIYQQGSFNELYDHLRQDRSCITFIKTGELSYWAEAIDHAMVVVGRDDQFICVNDPAFPDTPIQY